MQCLSSPTRSEIDKAHSQGIWLDIGVPSVRNLRRLSKPRVILWWLLATSSIPLHLLYNSAVFSTLCTQRYNAFLVTDEFLNGAPFNVSASIDGLDSYTDTTYWQHALQDYQQNQTSFVTLDNKKCAEAYTVPIISTNSDLLLISSYSNATNSLILSLPGLVSSLIYNKIGSGMSNQVFSFCVWPFLTACNTAGAVIDPRIAFNASQILHDASDGTSYTGFYGTTGLSDVQYCLSKRVDTHCKLEFSLSIMVVVIICNLIKAVCMGIIAWKQDPEPLVTLGDTIASFLDRPDVTTKRNCIAGKNRFEGSRCWGLLLSRWDPKHLRWFRAASRRRWIVCNAL